MVQLYESNCRMRGVFGVIPFSLERRPNRKTRWMAAAIVYVRCRVYGRGWWVKLPASSSGIEGDVLVALPSTPSVRRD